MIDICQQLKSVHETAQCHREILCLRPKFKPLKWEIVTSSSSVLASGRINNLINGTAAAVWWIYHCGNRVGHAGEKKGKTDSSRSIKQRANNKCVRDGRAAAINVKSIISQPDQNRALQAGCYDRQHVSPLTSWSFSMSEKNILNQRGNRYQKAIIILINYNEILDTISLRLLSAIRALKYKTAFLRNVFYLGH